MPTSQIVVPHPWSLQYIGLRGAAAVLRGLAGLVQPRAILAQRAAIPAGVTIRRIAVPSRDAGRLIDVDVYERAPGTGREDAGPRAVHVNFHGSGFVIPGLGSDTEFCALLASETNTIVLDADYRKAPEAPFPAAVNDAHDIITYIQSQPTAFDSSKITLSGFSAGANLALSLAVSESLAVSLGPSGIKGVASFYGNTNISAPLPPAPSTVHEDGGILPPFIRTFFYTCLILPSQDRKDLRLSPALASVDRWPREVYLACGDADDLWGPGKALADALEGKPGVHVEWRSFANVAHAFDKDRGRMKEETKKKTDEMYAGGVAMVRRAQE